MLDWRNSIHLLTGPAFPAGDFGARRRDFVPERTDFAGRFFFVFVFLMAIYQENAASDVAIRIRQRQRDREK
jgi:hypothetical protein